MNKLISVIGTGHLGSALIHGLIKSGFPNQQLTISNHNPEQAKYLTHKLGILSALNNQAAEIADILILAVKPQSMQAVCLSLAETIQKKRPLIISLAGVTEINHIALWLSAHDLGIVRVMANTPMEFCKGISALYANSYITSEQISLSEHIFKAVGSLFWVDKEQILEPLTAAIGCAPAYALLFMEALQKAAINSEIPEPLAKKIALEVVAGTIELVKQSDYSFAELRAGVTTPKGVTEYSLKDLSVNSFFDIFKKIYRAANKRIKQIKLNEQ